LTEIAEEHIFLTLARKAWAFRGRVIFAVVLLVLAKVAAVAVPILLKRIIDVFGESQVVLALPVALLAGYAAVRFSTTLFNELRDLIFARATQTTVGDYTLRIFRHLHALDARFHTDRATGALGRDVERGTSAIAFLLGVALFTILPTIVEIALVLAIMITNYAIGFAIIIAATFLVYSMFSVVLTRRRAIRQRRVNELDSNAHGRLVDSLLNYDTVKFYGNEDFEGRRFRAIISDWIEAGIRNQRALTSLHVGQSGIIAVGIASVMIFAGREVMAGEMTVGDLVLVNAYVIQVCLPLNSLGFVFREASDALIRAERLFALLRRQPEIAPGTELPALKIESGAVRFDKVGFGYEPNRQVLWDVDFWIPPGRTLAVVGGSGSGKSTLARLLLRFYDVWSGSILVDGQDIRQFSPASLRAAIGIVPQDTTLFNDTIAYNIGYGRLDATREEIVRAAEMARLHEFIMSLPQQYDTIVGERGLKLSGGEKQRVAIARTILKDPPILILDEATSALDTRSERAIQAALEQLVGPRTTLIVAHRLSTIIDADEILVLEHGRIVERGAHPELIARGGLYAQMWSLQEQERALRRSERSAGLELVNLSALIAGAIDAVGNEIEAKDLDLYTTLGLDVVPVMGDPGTLQEVVWELLRHAVRTSEPGSRVEVSLTRAGNELLLRITESGVEPASEPVRGRAREAGMSGDPRHFDIEALARIVEEHHGRLTLDRMGEQGTAYIAALPVAAVTTPPAKVAAAVERNPAPVSLQGRQIMIVDDDEDARQTLALLLELHGAETVGFGSGREALERLRAWSRDEWPDLMISDIGLPDEDGYDLLRRVRACEDEKRFPLAARMPAIALTGYAQADDRLRALVAGFQSHLAKPALPEELLRVIGRLLRENGRAPTPQPSGPAASRA
jgi:ATP-binding cassette subfamily B protein